MKTIRHTAVLQTDLAAARRLTGEVCRRHSGLQLVPGAVRRGTLAAPSQRLPVTATTGRQASYGYLELTPLDRSHTQVELALFALRPTTRRCLPGAERRALRRAERDVNAFAQALRPNRPRPAPQPQRSSPPADQGRRRWRLALGAGTVTVITTAGIASNLLTTHTTPVSEHAALERFRDHHTPTPNTEPDAAGDAVRTVRTEPTDDAATAENAPPDKESAQPDVQDAHESVPAHDEPADGDQAPDAAYGPEDTGAHPDDGQAESSLPEQGVYVYDTDGHERLDTAGAHRDYPQRTTITLTHDGCGIHEHWDVAEQRWGQRQTCVETDRTHLEQLTTYREFAGQSRHETFHCDDHAPDNALDQEPGVNWQLTCESEDTRLDTRVELTAREQLEIAGHSVEAVKLVYDTTMTGHAEGHQNLERWLRPTDGLLLQERSQTEADVDGLLGPVTYTEDYEIALADLEPRT